MNITEILNEDVKKLDKNKFMSLLTPAVLDLNSIMKSNGFEIRIVGGAVRDLVLGKEPKDIDMATDATPDEMISIFKENGMRYIPTGLQHGTITVVLDDEPIEITTLRIDKETDGRHAEVEFTKDWKQDAERRDLTYNAMSLDLEGNLYDYFGGIDDLKKQNSKFVGDASTRIEEDFLRILRYFRFQGRMSTPRWDSTIISTISNKAKGLGDISGERIWMEISKILSGNNTAEVLTMVKKTGVDVHILLPTDNIAELERVKQFTDDPNILLASLISSTDQLKEIRSSWKFSNTTNKVVEFILDKRDNEIDIVEAKKMALKYGNDLVADLALYLGKNDIADEINNWTQPEFPITGKDLMDAGLKSGPALGKTLKNLKNHWQESGFMASKEELLSLLYE